MITWFKNFLAARKKKALAKAKIEELRKQDPFTYRH
jgi:hypothetical protein